MRTTLTKALIVALCGSLLGGCAVYDHEESYYAPGVTPVTQGQVISMSKAGYPDSTIQETIRQNGVDHRPGADEIVHMKQQGVSSGVMNSMLEAPVTYYRPAREHRTVYYRDYSADPLMILGVGALAGYLIGHRHRH